VKGWLGGEGVDGETTAPSSRVPPGGVETTALRVKVKGGESFLVRRPNVN
jgi:hypothetical protein